MNNKGKLIKLATIASVILLGLIFSNSKVFAANYNLDVNCDGKKIEMISKTPDMTWNVDNMLPGQKDKIVINISNVGPKSVKVEFKATVVEGSDVADILNVKIVKIGNDSEQVEYDGKYSHMREVVLNLDAGKNQEYKIISSLPEETGNEFQEKQCQMKLNFTATGESDEIVEPPTPAEEEGTPEKDGTTPKETVPQKKYITTSEIKSPQTGESNAIYIVAGVLIFAFITLGLIYFIQKVSK